MPRVSVIVPNYNHGKYLPLRLESIFNQTFQDFEVILLDDCSSDNSREILELYRNHPKVSTIIYNKRIRGSPPGRAGAPSGPPGPGGRGGRAAGRPRSPAARAGRALDRCPGRSWPHPAARADRPRRAGLGARAAGGRALEPRAARCLIPQGGRGILGPCPDTPPTRTRCSPGCAGSRARCAASTGWSRATRTASTSSPRCRRRPRPCRPSR